VILLSNYEVARVYHKALEKDHTAIDSLLTRLEVIEIMEGQPLDIDGFREALARASLATTVIPIISVDAEDTPVPTSPKDKEPEASSSTTVTPESITESVISTSTPPLNKSSDSVEMEAATWLDRLLQEPTKSMTSSRYEIDEDELIDAQPQPVEKSDHQKIYERFQQERREKLRDKHRKEDAFERLERSKKGRLFTGYN